MYVVTTREIPDAFGGESDKVPAGALGWIAASTLKQAAECGPYWKRTRVILKHFRDDGTMWVGSVPIRALRACNVYEEVTAKALQFRLPLE